MKGEKFFTTGEVSEILDISRATVSRKFDLGLLTGKKNPITGDRLINYDSLVSFMKKYHLSINDIEQLGEEEEETENKYILLASTDENLQNILKDTFSKDNRIQLSIETSVYDALINCSKNPPDLFIIDEELPGISCKEAINSIKKNEELMDLKILCCLTKFDQNKISEIGADNYIIKEMLENITPERQKALIGYLFGDMTEDLLSITKYEKIYNEITKPESKIIFASKFANDLNNTISSISGNISILKNYLNDEKYLTIINDIESSCNYAINLSFDFLTASDNIYPIKKVHDLLSIIKESVNFVLRNSEIECEFSFDDDLWKVEIDKALFILVMNNIIANAIEAMPLSGKIKVTAQNITIDSKDKIPVKNGKYVKISITDQGHGIPKEYLPKIFDKYFSTKPNSSGLGLTTTNTIIQKHNGYIFVNSSVGVGTTVTIYLKAFTKDFSNFLIEDTSEKSLPSLKILLMDDQEQIRKTSERIFKYLNQDIYLVKTGEDAVEAYKNAKNSNKAFDLVIMDIIVSSGIDGKEAARLIFEFDEKAVIIASSGNIFTLEDFENNHFRGILKKPYSIKEAKELINTFVKEKLF
jgi:signal transduction histidine kinase